MRYLALLLAIALASACAAGCGSRKSAGTGLDPGAPAAGGGPAAGRTGGATVTILWPPRRARLIPAACNSIKVEMKSGAAVLQTRVADRPAGNDPSTLTFDALPVGALTAVATAYPEEGAHETPQARGSAPITITEGATAHVDLTMGSTIANLTLAPVAPAVDVGGSVTLAATARDADNSVVLVAPSVLQWTSDAAGVATVDSSGGVTAVSSGTAQVTVTDTESGKSGAATVSVNAVVVSVTPQTVSLLTGGTQQFTATVTGAADTSVTWSVVEGAAGGSVSNAGLYTAPATAGTYHVQATSVADPSRSATATVTLSAPTGQTWTNPKDGQEMVLVPAGAFTMGNDSGHDDEKPVHTVTLSAYYIGKTEVTVAQFRRFVNESGHTPEGSWQDYASNDQWPVNLVTWNDAKAYCDWAGLRLPTEAEWEKAARGTDALVYPWGNDWDAAKCNSGENGDGYSQWAPVGSFPAGASPYGCLDMAGNVCEWVNDWYSSSYYASSPANDPPGPSSGPYCVIRGGSWYNIRDFMRAACRSNFNYPGGGGTDCGFRCARSSN